MKKNYLELIERNESIIEEEIKNAIESTRENLECEYLIIMNSKNEKISTMERILHNNELPFSVLKGDDILLSIINIDKVGDFSIDEEFIVEDIDKAEIYRAYEKYKEEAEASTFLDFLEYFYPEFAEEYKEAYANIEENYWEDETPILLDFFMGNIRENFAEE